MRRMLSLFLWILLLPLLARSEEYPADLVRAFHANPSAEAVEKLLYECAMSFSNARGPFEEAFLEAARRDPKVVELIAANLVHPTPFMFHQAHNTLLGVVREHPAAASALVRAMAANPATIPKGADILRTMRPPGLADEVLDILKHTTHGETQRQLTWTLGVLPGQDEIRKRGFLHVLAEGEDGAKAQALSHLIELPNHDDEVLAVFVKGTKDPAATVRSNAAYHMKDLRRHNEATLDALGELLRHADASVRKTAAWALTKAPFLTKKAFDGLFKYAQSRREYNKEALEAVMKIPYDGAHLAMKLNRKWLDPMTHVALVEALKDSNAQVHVHAYEALTIAKPTDESVHARMAQLLDSGDAGLRGRIVGLCLKICRPEDDFFLEKLAARYAEETSPVLKETMQRTLKELGREDLITPEALEKFGKRRGLIQSLTLRLAKACGRRK